MPSVITFVTRLHIEQLVLPSWLTGRASILPIVTGQTYGSYSEAVKPLAG